MAKIVKVTGKVVSGKIADGSKSEHDAILLQKSDGEKLKLKISGGNPFMSNGLDKYKGKTISAKGIVNDYTFEVAEESIEEIKSSKSKAIKKVIKKK